MKRILAYIFGIILVAALASCSPNGKKYRIGVSQCSEDIWRHKLNDELRMGTYFHDGVELRLASADDSDERQIAQIDSLVQSGIDLLIVAPNQAATLTPAIDRAYDKGIPVIVFDRKTTSQKFTAYIGADNEEMGRQMGEYIASQLGGHGRVLEIMGLKGSSPAIERHRGFASAISRYPGIELVASLQGDWTEESAVQAINEYKGDLTNIDFVFGQNDRMAMGARKALLASLPSPLTTKFCGIDGLPGKDGGIQLVRDSILDASYIYPTHGDQLIQLAVDILEGKPYNKEVRLMSALVTHENANVLLMQNEEITRQSDYLEQLHSRADNYLEKLDTQRIITWMALGAVALLVFSIVLFYRYYIGKVNLRRERIVNNLWNLRPEDVAPTVSDTGLSEDVQDGVDDENSVKSSLFITRFREVVEARLSNCELGVEDLATDMNLSRVQLYRKVKAISGSSPIELLRTARLNRAYQLLLSTDKTVSEVAYEVGFTSPSYFSKCFKDKFGISPGEIR